MNNLFLVRHGNYNQDRLNEEGTIQMQTLGKKIRDLAGNGSLGMITSTAPRALDSALVLANVLGIQSFDQDPYLWSGSDAPLTIDTYYLDPDDDRLVRMIDQRKGLVDGLVVVSHLEVVRDFGKYYVQATLGLDTGGREPAKGRAYHIDLEGKRYQVI